MKKVGFRALIKDIDHKSLVCAEKATRVTLEFESTNKAAILNTLNELHRPDKYVDVVILERVGR